MLERDVQRRSVVLARGAGWWARKFATLGRRSAPDYIFAKDGRVFFCEFKATGEQPTELQAEEHFIMRGAGLTVWVCDDPNLFAALLAEEEPINV